MTMRTRPIRPNIYLPVVRFGVADSDWVSVLLISCLGYLAPVPFGITVLYVPLQMWTWLLATAGSIAFFNYIRIGRRPYWLPHKFKSLYLHQRQNRAMLNGRKRPFSRAWIIDAKVDDSMERDRAPTSPTTQGPPKMTELLEHNGRIQEAMEERWNT